MNHEVLERLKELIRQKYNTLDDCRGAYVNSQWLSVEAVVALIDRVDDEY